MSTDCWRIRGRSSGDLLDLIDRESPDFLIVAGDIFDRSVPPAEALALLGEFLSELRSRSALPVVFLGGNHDSPSRLSYGAELFSIQDIYFRSLPRSFTSPVEIKAGGQKVQIWCLPFLRKYDLLPEDLAPMEKSETVGAEDSFFRKPMTMRNSLSMSQPSKESAPCRIPKPNRSSLPTY
jgi:exonuclease SbcD